MPERKIGVGAIIGLAAAAGLLFLAIRAKAAPPEVYTCPVCTEEFATIEELQAHFTTAHPRTPIPIEWE